MKRRTTLAVALILASAAVGVLAVVLPPTVAALIVPGLVLAAALGVAIFVVAKRRSATAKIGAVAVSAAAALVLLEGFAPSSWDKLPSVVVAAELGDYAKWRNRKVGARDFNRGIVPALFAKQERKVISSGSGYPPGVGASRPLRLPNLVPRALMWTPA